MRRIFLFLFFILAVQVLFAQELKEGRYPDGKLRYKGYFRNGKPDGEVTHYYPDGKVKAVMKHRGEIVEAVLYSKDGEFTTSGRYIGQKRDGIWEYHRGSRLLLREEYEKNQLNGAVTRYYATGEVAEVKNWKAGVLSGVWKLFYDNEKLRMEVTFANGRLNGPMKSYAYDGVLVAEGKYDNGLKEGIWRFYNPGEKSERTLKYHRGVAENEEEEELEESRELDALLDSGKKIPDPALFTDDPESYMKLSGGFNK